MGVVERREREKTQRRTSIIDAAENIFFSKGISGATMDEVAGSAELSKGLLYVYFKNKDDLAHSVVHRGVRILQGYFEDALRRHETGIDQVRAIGEAYIRFAFEYPDYYDLMSWYQAHPPADMDPGSYADECDKCGQNTLALVAQAVGNGIQDGSVRSDLDPMRTAVFLWGQTHGLVYILNMKRVKNQYNVNQDELIETAFDLVRASLAPTSENS